MDRRIRVPGGKIQSIIHENFKPQHPSTSGGTKSVLNGRRAQVGREEPQG